MVVERHRFTKNMGPVISALSEGSMTEKELSSKIRKDEHSTRVLVGRMIAAGFVGRNNTGEGYTVHATSLGLKFLRVEPAKKR